jgi:hypothetical protein
MTPAQLTTIPATTAYNGVDAVRERVVNSEVFIPVGTKAKPVARIAK